ncbi:long-chain fatty acid--CoA ligase [Allokutzneria sp. A3M-2-11 16]|uniref:AMP-dependent synthetase/ligase n=1 Tax=Allokutzneria sp. A3M-2-11 16 TaxID=2962043 RepID=UPI0020B68545|nr:long-chain fatty acid--CoA ligase [Allokutzneria sp. A3M-2-11 16]MCP3803528.1 long-chain fatty acid--CoA ligase [Allokutzneria sp. A3M-2-11 16]
MAGIISEPGIRSIPGLLHARIRSTPDAEALRFRGASGWESLTWAETGVRVRELALGLLALGVGEGRTAAILSGTRVEWLLADLGVLATGAATTTIYPSNTADECAYVLADSGSAVVFAEDEGQVAKLRSVRERIPGVAKVIVIDGTAGADDDWVLTLDDVVELGRESHPAGYDRAVEAITPDRLATLIYTSGTTGRPKGVELTHDNWLYIAEAVDPLDLMRPDDLHLLWLPMSHVFGKAIEIAMINGGTPTAVDGAVDRIAANMAELRPTVLGAAPRIFEKIYNTVLATVRAEGGVKLRLFRWARGIGLRHAADRRAGRRSPLWLRARFAVADKLVFAKLRARFGGRVRYFVSGSAPLSPEIGEFFDAAGLQIREGYGLTETSAASFLARPDELSFGAIGRPLPGTEVRIADDGEVLIKGRGVMRGYRGLPEATAAALEDGWLHTGDIGELDERGRLRITDRKKELIKTSGGKYVAPQAVEGKIKAACPYVANALVHGDRRNFCVALVTLDPDLVAKWAGARGLSCDMAELTPNPELRAAVQEGIDAVNATLAKHETVKAFAILRDDFTVERGELTPSMKLRRRVVEEHYRDLLDGFYDGMIEKV